MNAQADHAKFSKSTSHSTWDFPGTLEQRHSKDLKTAVVVYSGARHGLEVRSKPYNGKEKG